jgi:hypothetical protein
MLSMVAYSSTLGEPGAFSDLFGAQDTAPTHTTTRIRVTLNLRIALRSKNSDNMILSSGGKIGVKIQARIIIHTLRPAVEFH